MQPIKSDQEIINEFMDNMEAFITGLPPAPEIEIRHIFNPGVYIRQMILPAGCILTSKIHKTAHTFIVSKGRILVYDGFHEAVILEASYTGTTLPGTRRMGISLEETVWSNVHPTKIKPASDRPEDVAAAVSKIERKVIQPYTNKLLKSPTMNTQIDHIKEMEA